MSSEELVLTDEEILAIAGKVDSAPVMPWQLKDNVVIGDIRRQVLSFARAVIEAQVVKIHPNQSPNTELFKDVPLEAVDPDTVLKLKG